MKKLFLLALCIVLAFSFVGCGVSEETEELLNYVNEDLSELAEIEEEFLESFESVRGDNYVDDATMHEEYSTNTIDIIEDWENKSAEIAENIKDSKIFKLHTTYTSYISKYRNVMNTVLVALEEQDTSRINEANDMLVETSKLAAQFRSELDDLADEYGVEIER